MQSDGVIAYKVRVGEKKPEFRCFTVDNGASTNFEYLRAKLESVFPALAAKKFIVNWIDNDGDKVVVSSDDELIFALSSMAKESVKKLYVNLAEKKEPKYVDIPFVFSARKRNPELLVEHRNVICDKCNKEIHGFRYKCLICPDFDLCQNCENSKHHANHFMIRIPVPIRNFQCDLRGSSFDEWLKNYTCKKISKPHFTDMEVMKTFSEEYLLQRTPHLRGKDKAQCKRARHIKKHSPSDILNSFSSIIGDYTNLAGDMILTSTSKPSTSNPSKKPSTSSKNQFVKPKPDNFTRVESNIQNCIQGILGIVPGLIDRPAHKNPVESETIGKIPTENTAATTAQEPAVTQDGAVENKNDDDKMAADAAGKEPLSNSDSGSDSDDSGSDCVILKTPAEEIERSYGWTMIDTDGPDMEAMNRNMENAQKEAINLLTKGFQNGMMIGDEASAPTSFSSTEAQTVIPETRFLLVDDDNKPATNFNQPTYILLNQKQTVPPMIPQPVQQPIFMPPPQYVQPSSFIHTPFTSSLSYIPSDQFNNTIPNFNQVGGPYYQCALPIPGFPAQEINSINHTPQQTPIPSPEAPATSAPPPTPRPIHREYIPTAPHITRAFEQMRNMGYGNENGWLAHLLEARDGNINEVLDIVSTVPEFKYANP